MSRIPEAFIHDLLARSDIVDVIGGRIELKRAGKEFKARSPFTNEKTPSFFVSPHKQMWFDFSSGKSGNAIGFLMDYDRLTFVEAVEELAKRAGVEVPREGGQVERVVMDGPLDALAAAQRFFTDQLRTCQPAVDYLKQRGVNGATAKLYGIGYAPESWDALTSFLKETKHAVDAGLLIQKDGGGKPDPQGTAPMRVYDRFRNRITFPIRDTRGRVIGFGGRTLGNDPAKYLNSPETPLFHKGRNLYGLYEAKQSATSALPYLIVVEGYMDAVMLAQHGIREVVATLGTATTREHLNLLFKSTSKVVFCFDGDRAGRSAAWRALEQALPEIFEQRECVFMFLPEGHDPDTLVQEIGADEFRKRIGEATPLSSFLLGELAKQVNLGSMDGRARLAGLARPHIEKLREGPLRTLLLDELSRLTRLSRADVESLGKAAASPEAQGTTPRPRNEPGAGRPVKRALQLLLEKPALAQKVQQLELLAQAEAPGIEMLVEALDFFHEHPEASAAQLLEFFASARREAATRLLASELNDRNFQARLSEIATDEGVEQEFMSCIQELVDQPVKARIDQLLAESRLRPLTEAETAELRVLIGRRSPP